MPNARRKLKRPGLKAERAFRRLIEAILNGDIGGGEVLREVRLARQWKVGRTPLREAMRRAAENGFVVLRTNRAPIVRLLSEKEIDDLYTLRELLELQAFRLAWSHLTPEDIRDLEKLALSSKPQASKQWHKHCVRFDAAMHDLWTERCGNKWLAGDLRRHYRLLRIFMSWFGHDEKALTTAYQEHLEILKAIKHQNLQDACEALHAHIRHSAQMARRSTGAVSG